jgi:DNA-binding CsgD family transcriptional regulator
MSVDSTALKPFASDVVTGVAVTSIPPERGAEVTLQITIEFPDGRAVVELDLHRQPRADTAGTPLSPREMQIADLLLLGCGSDAIALRLGISRHTVKDHRKRIFRKLGIGSLAELFALYR